MENWKFSQIIINWQHLYGRNNLPWQINNTPYYVWISEIMLQQTQVKTVIPYFNKFILQFNNIDQLSKANLDQILYLWSGLGYYNRAHNIYKTAKIIQKQYNGTFPKDIIKLINLPGIGKTTAGAILSLSYNLSFPILDGNVKRILKRFYNLIELQKAKNIEKKLWKLITLITPIHNANKFNQGMMDLGSLICIYKKPKCNICPINKNCKYEYNKIQYNISKRKIFKKKKYYFIIIQNKTNILLEKRKTDKIWKNLFCFPQVNHEKNIKNWLLKNNFHNQNYQIFNTVNHTLSNIKLKIIFFKIILKKKDLLIKNKYNIWYNLFCPKKIGLPKPIKNIILELKNNILNQFKKKEN